MPDGEQLTNQLEFEERLRKMSIEEQSIFNAKQVYFLTTKVDNLDKKFDTLSTYVGECIPSHNKKTSAISGGISGGIIAAVIAIIEYFRGR